jgi:maleylacetate reductase
VLSGTHRYPRQEEVVYGRPAAEALVDAAGSYGAARLMIVTTRSLASSKSVLRIREALGERCVGAYSAVRAHSPRQDVVDGAEHARELGCDLLVAIGGGSVIDATKAMQLCLWAGVRRAEQLDAYRAGAGSATLEPTLRMVAVPTTLSAAEFTPFAGITDPARRVKEGFYHPDLAPRKVVLDAEMTLDTPTELWFSTGMKAVDHAVEQLSSLERSPFADALAEAGLGRLARALRESHRSPEDLRARLDCQIGMWLAMSGAGAGRGLGASHAIGHTLGGMLGVPHGLTSSIMLPAVLRWNESVLGERGPLISRLLDSNQASPADAVKRLCTDLGIPTSLSSVGIRAEQFRAIAEHTLHDRGVRTNPRPIRKPEDIEEILTLAL